MIITELKKIGKGQRFSLFLDGEFMCSLEAEIIVKNHLSKGIEINIVELERIKKENGELTCFEKSLSLIERSLKSEKMLRQALFQKGYFKETIDKAVNKLKEYGYINDENFCESYIRTYQRNKGKRKLAFELTQKGINQSIIENKLDELLCEENEDENCFNLLCKFLKNKEENQKNKQKAYNHLLNKGYSYGTIKNAFEKKGEYESWN